jgi:hypothetical protein
MELDELRRFNLSPPATPTVNPTQQAVEENSTEMKAFPDRLFPCRLWEQGRIVRVRSYLEAMGFLAAHKAGLNPGALTPNVASIRELVQAS